MIKCKKTFLKESKGITLIALVITIIVLLILAGVAINTLTGENGVINRATDTKEKTDIAQIQEEIQLAWNGVQVEGIAEGWNIDKKADELQKELYKEDETTPATATARGNDIEVKYKGYETIIKTDGTMTPLTKITPGDDTIQIIAKLMSGSEIRKKGITRQQENSVIIKVTQQITKEQLQAMEQTNPDKVQNMYVLALDSTGDLTWEDLVSQFSEPVGDISGAYEYMCENERGFADYVHGMGCDDAYDFISKQGTYENEIEPLKYICNINNEDIVEIGRAVYFELTEAGTYDIIAKNWEDNTVGTVAWTLNLKFQVGDDVYCYDDGMTWQEWIESPYNSQGEFYITTYDEDDKQVLSSLRGKTCVLCGGWPVVSNAEHDYDAVYPSDKIRSETYTTAMW